MKVYQHFLFSTIALLNFSVNLWLLCMKDQLSWVKKYKDVEQGHTNNIMRALFMMSVECQATCDWFANHLLI